MENDKPYEICDVNRDKMKGIIASSLADLLAKVPEELGMPSEKLTVVLDCDGTEVRDEEYFSTYYGVRHLAYDLAREQEWSPNIPKCKVSLYQTDDVALGDRGQVARLLSRLQRNLCHISQLGEKDLELLSDIDSDRFKDIVWYQQQNKFGANKGSI